MANKKIVFNLMPLALCSAAYFLVCCGNPGLSDEEKPKRTLVAKDEKVTGTVTRLPFRSLEYQAAEGVQCLKKTASGEVYRVKQDLSIDGDLADWGKVPLSSGSLRASNLGFPLLKVAMSPASLMFAVKMPKQISEHYSKGRDLLVELGGVLLRSGKIIKEQRRQFRVVNGKVYDYENGWNELHAPYVKVSTLDDVVELKLSKNLLGDSLSWNLWSYRVMVVDKGKTQKNGIETQGPILSEDIVFGSNSRFFKSISSGDGVKVKIEDCHHWAAKKSDFSVEEITIGASAGAQNSFAYFRSVLNDLTKFLGEDPIGDGHVTVIVNDWKVAPSISDFQPSSLENISKQKLETGYLMNSLLGSPNALFASSATVLRASIAEHLIRSWLLRAQRTLSEEAREAYVVAMTNHFIKEEIGETFWFDIFPSTPSYIERQLTKQWDQSFKTQEQAKGGARNFGHLLSLHFSKTELKNSWLEAKLAKFNEDPEEDSENQNLPLSNQIDYLLEKITEEARREQLSGLKNGWVVGTEYAAKFAPESILDTDGDGLFDWLEELIYSNKMQVDTDQDGWSDYGEYLTSFDPLQASLRPNALIPDGDFSDWFELVPQRIHFDEGAEGDCPKGGDIEQFAAIRRDGGILVGAKAKNFWMGDRAAWEVVIENTDTSQGVVLSSATGSKMTQISDEKSGKVIKVQLRAVPTGIGSVEWFLSEESVKQYLDLKKEDKIRVRFLTSFGAEKKLFCDETSWIEPLIVQ